MASVAMYGSQSSSGTQPTQKRIPEKAAQTFLQGVPASVDGTGNLVEWDGATVTGAIKGIVAEPARNRTTSGTPQLISPLGFSVQNQPNAQIIALPPFDDGNLNVYVANNDTTFYGEVGPNQLSSSVVITGQYGMTKDTDNHWYVDLNKNTPGVNTVVQVLSVDDWDTRGVYFKILPAAQQ